MLSVTNLPTPIDIYLPADTDAQSDESVFNRVLVTSGATSLVGLQTGGGSNVAVKIVLLMNDHPGWQTFKKLAHD